MNYSAITQELIEKRFDVLPEKVRTVLDSEKTREETKKIAAANFLNDEQTEIAEQLTALILLGFANPNDLQNELIAIAGLTEENAAKIASAIKEEVLSQAGNDLGRVYSPLAEEPTINEIKAEAAKEIVATRTPIDVIAVRSAPSAAVTEPAPAMLYQEKQSVQPAETRKPLNRPFSFAFNIFKGQTATPKSEVQARIETTDDQKERGNGKAVKLTLPKRTVHYSEFRSPVTPFSGQNVTNLPTTTPAETAPAPIIIPETKPMPTKEENDGIIDLRNL